VSWEVRVVISFLVVFSSALFLVSVYLGVRAGMEARKHFPLQFADELSSRYYMMYALFNRSIPAGIRRRLGVSSALALAALAGFAAVAWLSGNPALAVMLLVICGFSAGNILVQWRSARR
jgi:hypothetical protein